MKTAQGLVRGNPDEPVSLFWRGIEKSDAFASASTILCYMSISGEVPAMEAIQRWSAYKTIALPLVRGEMLELRKYHPEKLVRGYKNILEPSMDAELLAPSDIELAFVPGVAFCRKDGRVLRLGRGGGFYDRLLPLMTCRKVGVCFDYRELDDIPIDPWDAVLDDLAVCKL